MCGIAGIITFEHQPTSFYIPALLTLSTTLQHRGPDDEGFLLGNASYYTIAGGKHTPPHYYTDYQLPYVPTSVLSTASVAMEYAQVGLVFRRLSILDISGKGHQPFSNADASIWLVFNGEIYNYAILRQKLTQKGYVFHTETDTEVVLAMYQEYGTDCIHQFNGMWSLVIWDRKAQTIFASRDRTGVKPFYYYKDKDKIAFASEQKALLSLPFVPRICNPNAVFDYLVLGQIEYEQEGFFESILELPAGHNLHISIPTKEIKVQAYWNPTHLAKNTLITSSNDDLEQLLLQAITLRLRADVPIAATLSGGLDSSTIVGMMRKQLPTSYFPVFTSCFEDKKYDESDWAKKVIDYTKTNWQPITINEQDCWSNLEELTYCQDIPLWSVSTFAHFQIMKEIQKQGIKVVLDGQGADELFAGYPIHLFFYWLELWKKRDYKLLKQEMQLKSTFKNNYTYFFKYYTKYELLRKLPNKVLFQLYPSYFKHVNYLNKDFWEAYKHRLLPSIQQPLPETLQERLGQELYNTSLKMYLKIEDRSSMWHSIEARTPFADDIGLMNFSFQQTAHDKIQKGILKHSMRQAVTKYLPADVVHRKDKKGYTSPNNVWIENNKESFKPLFNNEVADYLNIQKIHQNYDQLFSISNQIENGRTFKFISFPMWKKVFRV